MPRDRHRPGGGGRLARIAARVIIPVLFSGLLWHLFTHVARFGTVVSESMAPTLEIGDYYVLRVDAYRNGRSPERGDIVVFERPAEGAFVKRVVGIGGDTIAFASGRVWLNGAWLSEPYLTEEPVPEMPLATRVPEGHVFVLGDNRNHSEDSRDYGPVPVDSVKGNVTKILWPLSRARGFSPVEYR